MERQTSRETVVTRLAEWGITLNENELDQLVPAYEHLLRWQGIVEEMLQQKKLIEALEAAGLRDKVKVMVGVAPVTESYAREIGADGYAEDAISAVDMAFRLADAPA